MRGAGHLANARLELVDRGPCVSQSDRSTLGDRGDVVVLDALPAIGQEAAPSCDQPGREQPGLQPATSSHSRLVSLE